MKRLPKSVKIGGHTIQIEQSTTLDCMGQYERSKALISVDKSLAPSQKAATILHEVLHVIIAETHPTMSESLEEKLVTTLETGLFAFIKDNPKLIRYMESA